MKFARNQHIHSEPAIRIGGRDYAPPTLRLRAACVSAYSAARVERTGEARSHAELGERPMDPAPEKGHVRRMERVQ